MIGIWTRGKGRQQCFPMKCRYRSSFGFTATAVSPSLAPSELDVESASADAYESYHAALGTYVRRHAPDCVVPQLDPGDLVVFASTTPHGTLPFEQPSRRAMQVIVRPSNLRWGSWPQFDAGLDHSPNGPWGALKSVGDRWRIVCKTTV